MADPQQGIFFTLLDREFFESLDAYRPGRELVSLAEEAAGPGWTTSLGGYWTQLTPSDARIGEHGWKLHLSAVPATAEDTLRRVLPLLVEERVPFKFNSDLNMVQLTVSKNFPRSGAGKFITVYPADEAQFIRLAVRLHQATAGLRGPYILTDRPYADSRVVFYRYGEHRGSGRVGAAGTAVPTLTGPDGEEFRDDRKPYFSLPSWVKDPFTGHGAALPAAGEVVLKDRYRVTKAIRFSSVGGIYEAVDTHTGEAVIVREARPMLAAREDASDAQGLLRKEARILRRLEDTGYLPRLVDLFPEWEHLFLVQEKLDAQPLWTYALEGANAASLDLPSPRELFDTIRGNVRKLVEGLAAVHARGVVLRDFTKANVLVTKDHRFKFIDFELAYELDGDEAPLQGHTAGYASPQQVEGDAAPTPADDWYALGALIMDTVSYNASALPLNRDGALAAMRFLLRDLGLPIELHDAVVGLTDPDPARRWTPARAMALLDSVGGLSHARPEVDADAVPVRPAPARALREAVEETLDGICGYILSVQQPERHDRYWPGSAETFTTNGVGVQYGATGIAHFLLRATGSVPDGALAWIRGAIGRKRIPPSLFNGRAGWALLLAELGDDDGAAAELDAAYDRELALERPDLYYGAAGWGAANLEMWRRTGEERFRERAVEAGRHLISTAENDENGTFWSADGKANHGWGHGSSGVAAFLTWLAAADDHPAWIGTARAALEWEIAGAERRDTRVLWVEAKGEKVGPRLPHMRYGSAGVGSAALRFWAATGEERFLRFAEACAHTVANRYTNKLWQDFGLAGYGELLLDMHAFTGEENYLHNAWYLAEAILPSRIARPAGYAFAGQEQSRISCDVGMGSAGIGLFLHRLLNPATPRLLVPDALLAGVLAGSAYGG